MKLSVFAQAISICIVITGLVALIEVAYRSKVRINACFSWYLVIYFVILAIGNSAATLLGSITVADKLSDSLTPYAPFLYAFFGVFAFEGIMSNTNITLFDKGVLTIQDWISKARDPAVARAVQREAEMDDDLLTTSANRLRGLSEPVLNTYIAKHLGIDAVTQMERDADAAGADRIFYKALELATKAPTQTASILREARRQLR